MYLLAPLAWLLSAGVFAGNVTVHTWIDEQGVRHFADAPPSSNIDTAQLVLYEPDPDVAGVDDYYSIVNQWSRMRDERAARDELSLERERLRLERAQKSEHTTPVYADYPRPVVGGFVPYGYGRRIGFGDQGYGRSGHGPGSGDIPRDVYLQDRRKRGFTPSGTPTWPRQRW